MLEFANHAAPARTANSVNDSDSNNFRNGTSGHLLFNPTKPGRVSRANDENNPRLSYPMVAIAPSHGRVCTEECNAAPHIVPIFIDTDFTAVRRTNGKQHPQWKTNALNMGAHCKTILQVVEFHPR